MEYKTPVITQELIDYLSRVYPDRFPDKSMSDRDIWIKCGEVGVLRHLSHLLLEQQNNMLGSSNLTKR